MVDKMTDKDFFNKVREANCDQSCSNCFLEDVCGKYKICLAGVIVNARDGVKEKPETKLYTTLIDTNIDAEGEWRLLPKGKTTIVMRIGSNTQLSIQYSLDKETISYQNNLDLQSGVETNRVNNDYGLNYIRIVVKDVEDRVVVRMSSNNR